MRSRSPSRKPQRARAPTPAQPRITGGRTDARECRGQPPDRFLIYEVYQDRAAFEEHIGADSGRIFCSPSRCRRHGGCGRYVHGCALIDGLILGRYESAQARERLRYIGQEELEGILEFAAATVTVSRPGADPPAAARSSPTAQLKGHRPQPHEPAQHLTRWMCGVGALP